MALSHTLSPGVGSRRCGAQGFLVIGLAFNKFLMCQWVIFRELVTVKATLVRDDIGLCHH